MLKKCTPLWREAPCRSQNVQNTPRSDHFWKLKVHAVVARSTFRSQNVQNTSASDRFWKLRCRKSARRCGAKHISKSKVQKNWPVRGTFGRSDVLSRGKRKGLWTLAKVSKTCGFCSISKNAGRRGTFEEDLQRCISRPTLPPLCFKLCLPQWSPFVLALFASLSPILPALRLSLFLPLWLSLCLPVLPPSFSHLLSPFCFPASFPLCPPLCLSSRFVSQLVPLFVLHLVPHCVSTLSLALSPTCLPLRLSVSHFVSRFAAHLVSHCVSHFVSHSCLHLCSPHFVSHRVSRFVCPLICLPHAPPLCPLWPPFFFHLASPTLPLRQAVLRSLSPSLPPALTHALSPALPPALFPTLSPTLSPTFSPFFLPACVLLWCLPLCPPLCPPHMSSTLSPAFPPLRPTLCPPLPQDPTSRGFPHASGLCAHYFKDGRRGPGRILFVTHLVPRFASQLVSDFVCRFGSRFCPTCVSHRVSHFVPPPLVSLLFLRLCPPPCFPPGLQLCLSLCLPNCPPLSLPVSLAPFSSHLCPPLCLPACPPLCPLCLHLPPRAPLCLCFVFHFASRLVSCVAAGCALSPTGFPIISQLVSQLVDLSSLCFPAGFSLCLPLLPPALSPLVSPVGPPACLSLCLPLCLSLCFPAARFVLHLSPQLVSLLVPRPARLSLLFTSLFPLYLFPSLFLFLCVTLPPDSQSIPVWVSSRISGGLTPLRELIFCRSKRSNLLKWCFRSSLNFLQNNFWRPLSRKILIFWVV